MKCQNCGFDNPDGMNYCGMCGAQRWWIPNITQTCASCGFANPAFFKFCGKCGKALIEERILPADLDQGDQAGVAGKASVARLNHQRSSAPIQLEGERRVVTVIMADVTSSTNLLERIGSEAWVNLMNRVLHILESEIYRFGGKVDQFRGDGLVAFFGANIAHEDDPERAILAALAMQRSFKTYASELLQRDGLDLRIRIGVNTGEVIVASVGDSRQHSEDTAMGEAVALAARMETAAEPGTVLVSENTFRLAEMQFEWMELGEINVKGLSRPIAVYRPQTTRADADQLRKLQAYGLSHPLVGREEEFQALKKYIEDLFLGKGGIFILSGDKGIGKSLLVNEVWQYFIRQGALQAEVHEGEPPALASQPLSFTWIRGRCRSYDLSWPYAAWLDLFHNWLNMPPDASREEVLARLVQKSKKLWGESFSDHYPYLASFLNLPVEEEIAKRLNRLDAEELRRKIFSTVRG